jgi:hypothetical protein
MLSVAIHRKHDEWDCPMVTPTCKQLCPLWLRSCKAQKTWMKSWGRVCLPLKTKYMVEAWSILHLSPETLYLFSACQPEAWLYSMPWPDWSWWGGSHIGPLRSAITMLNSSPDEWSSLRHSQISLPSGSASDCEELMNYRTIWWYILMDPTLSKE